MIMDHLRRPKNFYFGAATSAHQVEGGNRNDWTEWEHANSARLAAKAASRHANGKTRGTFFHKKIAPSPPTRIPDYILKNYPNPLQEENYVSGRACDHYHRFREDFDIAKSLGHNAHRFSVEWSRIEPEEGKFSEKEIEHYREVIRALRERGLEPLVTLWHWTVPIWFARKGGFENKRNAFYFCRFSQKIAGEFKNEVRFWIILDEPGLWAGDAYLFGIKPPQKRSILKTARVYFNLINVHREAYRMMKQTNSAFFVGIAESSEWTEFLVLPRVFRKLLLSLRNYFFLRRIKDSLDFVGVNYYRKNRLFGDPTGDITDTGWEIFPQGLYLLVKGVWERHHLPIFVTENGLADARDIKRAKFIKDHVAQVVRALREGIDVRGYFHWSLLDNFEWDSGFWPRFGLVEVDYKTQERKIRRSAMVYKEIIEENSY